MSIWKRSPSPRSTGWLASVESRQREYEPVHKKMLVLGITLCIVSVLPLLAVATTGDEFLVCAATACIFPLVAVGVNLIVRTASIWGSYQKLLEAGDFTREKKAENKRDEPFVVFYWCLVLAVYLGLSFVTRRWDTTWIVWPVMAVLFGAALALKSMLQKKP